MPYELSASLVLEVDREVVGIIGILATQGFKIRNVSGNTTLPPSLAQVVFVRVARSVHEAKGLRVTDPEPVSCCES